MKSLDPAILNGKTIRLEPLRSDLYETVQKAANDPRLWEVTVVRAYGEYFDTWWYDAIKGMQQETRLPFAVISQADQKVIGSTSYLNIAINEQRLEIGSTFYAHNQWGSKVNPECKLLLMTYAFETLGIRRVEFCVDAINTRSRAAVTKLGAVQEGFLRCHRNTWSGRRRDTVMFSVVDSEWPKVKQGLQARSGSPPC
ncbi:MAG: GNAT family protein [Gemmatales bacterium]